MFKLKNMSKRFGNKEILNNVSFEVSSQEVVGLVGLNGSGKTTLIRLLLGLINADSGSSEILGNTPSPRNSHILRKTGIILDNDGFNGNMTFIDNMRFYAKIKRENEYNLMKYIKKYWPHLMSNTTPVKQYSKGERTQCAIARAFISSPKVLIFDEPMEGLDYEQCDKFYHMVKRSQCNGSAILISSHNFFALDKLCTKIIELKNTKTKDVSNGFFNHI